MGRDYPFTRRLVTRLGLRLTASPMWPLVRPDPSARPRLRPSTGTGLAALAAQVRDLCRSVDPERPWAGARTARLDRLDVAGWLDAIPVDARTRRLLASAIRAFTTAPPDRLSLLAFLLWLHPAGGHRRGADRGTWPGTMEGAIRDGIRVAGDIQSGT